MVSHVCTVKSAKTTWFYFVVFSFIYLFLNESFLNKIKEWCCLMSLPPMIGRFSSNFYEQIGFVLCLHIYEFCYIKVI